jgi:hypothetical protein
MAGFVDDMVMTITVNHHTALCWRESAVAIVPLTQRKHYRTSPLKQALVGMTVHRAERAICGRSRCSTHGFAGAR